jgi:surface-anchored protein
MKSLFRMFPLVLPFASLPLSAAVVISGGHIDAPAFGYDSADGFEPHLHNEGGPNGAIINGVRVEEDSEFEPDEAVIRVALTSTTTLNGKSYFWLPDDSVTASTNGVPFVGIGLEELDAGDWAGLLTIQLADLAGPGDFLMWTTDLFGETVVLLDSLDPSKSLQLAAGSHSHFNWGFTEPGIYELTFGISGNHLGDGPVSGEGTFGFAVPEPSSALLGALGGLALLRRRRGA